MENPGGCGGDLGLGASAAAAQLGRATQLWQLLQPDVLVRVGRDAKAVEARGRGHDWRGVRVGVLGWIGSRIQHGGLSPPESSSLGITPLTRSVGLILKSKSVWVGEFLRRHYAHFQALVAFRARPPSFKRKAPPSFVPFFRYIVLKKTIPCKQLPFMSYEEPVTIFS